MKQNASLPGHEQSSCVSCRRCFIRFGGELAKEKNKLNAHYSFIQQWKLRFLDRFDSKFKFNFYDCFALVFTVNYLLRISAIRKMQSTIRACSSFVLSSEKNGRLVSMAKFDKTICEKIFFKLKKMS